MTLLAIAGFDNCVASTPASLPAGWTFYSGITNADFDVATSNRFGSGSGRMIRHGRSGTASHIKNAVPTGTRDGVFGAAFQFPVASSANLYLVSPAYTFTSYQITLRTDGSGKLALYRGATLLGTGTTVIAAGEWHYIEMKFYIDNTTGYCHVKMDGNTEINVTSVDTQDQSGNTIDGIAFMSYCYFDDYYFCDFNGTVNNDFLGDSRVESLMPDGAGASTQWAVSGAASNYLAVDDLPDDGDTSYVYDNITGQKDRYTMANPAGSVGTVHGVQIEAEVKKIDPGDNTVKLLAYDGTTEGAGPAVSPVSGSYDAIAHLFETKPSGGAWDSSTVNSMEAGIEIG